MQTREYCLPAGWYPRNPAEIEGFVSPFVSVQSGARAAIAPHAGWFFSGRLAAQAAASLDRRAETLVILGGHLGAGSPPLFAMEDGVRTPLGIMPVDAELRGVLLRELAGRDDCYRDNTIEVLLPLARFFFPRASLLWLRLPAEMASFEAGALLAKTAAHLGRRVAVLASTDLTHYGANYGFSPAGGGSGALRWVRDVNDRNFIQAVEAENPALVLERAEKDCSACSAGAVLGALGFARTSGAGHPRLLGYATSADVLAERGEMFPDSFVGYAAFAF
jgi:AmmeMemoRadiSam system protein B